MPQLNLFTDIDSDGDQDILFLACIDSVGRETSWCLLNEKGSYRTAAPLSFPPLGEPTSFSLVHANNDRSPDLIIGTARGVRLLLNTQRLDYRDISQQAFSDSLANAEVRGCAWLDVQGGGSPSLWTLDTKGVWTGWRREMGGEELHLTPTDRVVHPYLSGGGRFYAGDWADGDRDGVVEPLLVRSVTTQVGRGAEPPRTTGVVRRGNVEPTTGSSPDMVLPFAERRASCAWADVNMDGRLDLLALTARPCRPVTLMMQQADGRFVDATFEAGLARFSAGPDAVWVDFDNDQRLDIATTANGRLTLLCNTMEARDGLAVDLASMSTGTTLQLLELATRERRLCYDVSMGRGQLMQAPLRLVLPAGGANDSVKVIPLGGNIETMLVGALKV